MDAADDAAFAGDAVLLPTEEEQRLRQQEIEAAQAAEAAEAARVEVALASTDFNRHFDMANQHVDHQIRKAEEYHEKMLGARDLTPETSEFVASGDNRVVGVGRAKLVAKWWLLCTLAFTQLMLHASQPSSPDAPCVTTSSKACSSVRRGTSRMRVSFLQVCSHACWSLPRLLADTAVTRCRRDGPGQDRPDHRLCDLAEEKHRPDAHPDRRASVHRWGRCRAARGWRKVKVS